MTPRELHYHSHFFVPLRCREVGDKHMSHSRHTSNQFARLDKFSANQLVVVPHGNSTGTNCTSRAA